MPDLAAPSGFQPSERRIDLTLEPRDLQLLRLHLTVAGESVRLIKVRGVSYAQAAEDLGVHPTQLRDWVKKLADDPQHAFPGHLGEQNLKNITRPGTAYAVYKQVK